MHGIRSDRLPEELYMEVCNTVQAVVIKIIPKKRNAKGKAVVSGGIKIG